MKLNFKKIASVLTGAIMLSSTMGFAAAASFPAPFVSNGASDAAVIVTAGTHAGAMSDMTAAIDLTQTHLNPLVTAGGSGDVIITGTAVSLASGSDLLYLNDEFNENVQTLTKDDLPKILEAGTFTDDDGTNYNFEQTVTIGSHADNHFAFSNSDNDLEDPALTLELSDTPANEIYAWTITFNTAVNFTSSDSQGEEINIFGKTYTVSTSTDDNTLILLGGADSATIEVGESVTMTVGEESYEVSLLGLSSDSTTKASISVNGESKTFTEGQTKNIGGVDLYAKTVFRTGDTGTGHVVVQLGADKLTIETGNAVQVGSDNDDIDGTLVTLTPATATGIQALTKIQIEVSAEDNDNNHLLVGESFVDPVFGTMKVDFANVVDGPTFTEEKDTGRTDLEIQKGGNRELQLTLTDAGGNTATVPFTYQNTLQDDDGDDIEVVEGAYIAKDEYFILNSGNNQHLMELTKSNLDDAAASDVAMKDIITGETYTFDNHDFTSGYAATILGQTYTITNVSATEVTIVSSDYGTGIANGNDIAVFPYIELVSGEDTRVAFTDDVQAVTDLITGASTGISLELPTGTMEITTNTTVDIILFDGTAIAIGADDSLAIGDVYYNFAVADGATANGVNVTVAIDAIPGTGVGDTPVTTPGVLFVEDEDKSEATTTTKPAIHIVTTDGGTYSTVSAPLFTGTSDTETWDDTDFTGWLTNYGTYVWRDTSDTNQNFVGLSYGDDMMYAEVYFAEEAASITAETTPNTGGQVLVYKDSEVSSFSDKNLVIVGGSCVNEVAAKLLGSDVPVCGADFTTATSVISGGYIIKVFDNPYTTGKIAMLVAGYEASDTVNAIAKLKENTVSTVVGTEVIYPTTSA